MFARIQNLIPFHCAHAGTCIYKFNTAIRTAIYRQLIVQSSPIFCRTPTYIKSATARARSFITMKNFWPFCFQLVSAGALRLLSSALRMVYNNIKRVFFPYTGRLCVVFIRQPRSKSIVGK